MFFAHNPWLNVTFKLRKQKINNRLPWSLLTGSDHNSVLKSRLPACFFFLILLSCPFLHSNPDPTLIFVMSFMLQSIHYWNKHYIRLTWQRAALMFKVLDLTINDCNFIFCLLVFFFVSASVQNRRFTSIWVLPVDLGRWKFQLLYC